MLRGRNDVRSPQRGWALVISKSAVATCSVTIIFLLNSEETPSNVVSVSVTVCSPAWLNTNEGSDAWLCAGVALVAVQRNWAASTPPLTAMGVLSPKSASAGELMAAERFCMCLMVALVVTVAAWCLALMNVAWLPCAQSSSFFTPSSVMVFIFK